MGIYNFIIKSIVMNIIHAILCWYLPIQTVILSLIKYLLTAYYEIESILGHSTTSEIKIKTSFWSHVIYILSGEER